MPINHFFKLSIFFVDPKFLFASLLILTVSIFNNWFWVQKYHIYWSWSSILIVVIIDSWLNLTQFIFFWARKLPKWKIEWLSDLIVSKKFFIHPNLPLNVYKFIIFTFFFFLIELNGIVCFHNIVSLWDLRFFNLRRIRWSFMLI